MAPLAHDLASHVLARGREQLRSAALDEARTLLRDYLGVALRGSRTDVARIVSRYQAEHGSTPAEATVIGPGLRVGATAAAFCNAVATHSLELDDTDQLSMLHVSAPVVSAALACAETVDSSGSEFLAAIVAGYEVMQALSDGANPGMRDRGFHSTAVCGVFGAAAAAGLLLGLGHGQLVSAFGAAGAQACGVFEIYGPTMQKALQPGSAAHNGVTAARLARLGFTGADSIIDGQHGVFSAFTNAADPAATRRRLQAGAPIGIEYKPYSCFRPIHTAIDCARAVRHDLAPASVGSIASLTLSRHPDWAGYHLNPHPRSEREAKGSIHHGVAVALLSGDALLEHFAGDYLADPTVQRLSSMLVVETDRGLARGDSCRLRVELADGQVLEHQVDYPKGSLHVPMSEDEHLAKFSYLTGAVLSPARTDRVLRLVESIEMTGSVRELTALLHTDVGD